ncbi:hypothetical protein BXZ70DRAFT_907881 [Cristinia sonorae]|uniref:Uncharacterized protein n=1 Tax=Cristinia sonorae TaxID=1940300 RepID=A0A8K0UMZ6_9AGAR|nr:hypothetical protein BXZ70DRAFT_907881 [Cristinia sonorae]
MCRGSVAVFQLGDSEELRFHIGIPQSMVFQALIFNVNPGSTGQMHLFLSIRDRSPFAESSRIHAWSPDVPSTALRPVTRYSDTVVRKSEVTHIIDPGSTHVQWSHWMNIWMAAGYCDIVHSGFRGVPVYSSLQHSQDSISNKDIYLSATSYSKSVWSPTPSIRDRHMCSGLMDKYLDGSDSLVWE